MAQTLLYRNQDGGDERRRERKKGLGAVATGFRVGLNIFAMVHEVHIISSHVCTQH